MRDVQARLDEETVKAVIHAVLTRWTAHYQSYSRLLDLHLVLVMVIDTDEKQLEKDKCIVTGDSKAKKKAKAMITLVKNDDFWRALLWYGSCALSYVYSQLMKT